MKLKKIFVTDLVSVLALGNVMIFTQKSSAAVEQTSLASVFNVNEAFAEKTFNLNGDSLNVTINCDDDFIVINSKGSNQRIDINNQHQVKDGDEDEDDSNFWKDAEKVLENCANAAAVATLLLTLIL